MDFAGQAALRKWVWSIFRGRKADAAALAEKDAALAALFETGTAGIAEVDIPSGKFVRVNRRFCEMMRREAAELLTMRPGDIMPAEHRAAVEADVRAALKRHGKWEAEVRHLLPDGEILWARVGASIWKWDENGAPRRRIAVVQDITESVKVKERLKTSEELIRLGHQVGKIGSFSRDLKTGLITCSRETLDILGLPPDGGGSRTFESWLSRIAPEDQARVSAQIKAALQRGEPEIAVEHRIVRSDTGKLRHIELRARYFYDESGQPIRSVGVAIDVTERKHAEEQLSFAARHDALTGLANRALFGETLSAATARALQGQDFAVLCLDLDRFKDVNDALGHAGGDQLLVEAARRLREELRADDLLARLGGDEFAVIQSTLCDPGEAGRLAARLVERVREPFEICGQRVTVGVSIGVALAPRDGADCEQLLRAADLALYHAKAQTNSGWRFFEPGMSNALLRRRELEADLRAALEKDEFELFYQPVLDVSSLKIRTFEALIRWRHPVRGLVTPDRFVPLCEDVGLIAEVGAWVLRRACLDAKTWPQAIGVAVNISGVQFSRGRLDRVVEAALRESGLEFGRLELEITETSLLKDSETTIAMLHKIKALGVSVAMDDFGAGHSSLGYLQSFPFDKVKIDRAFAKGVDKSAKSVAIVKAMLDLCAALGIATTIEGVETESQFQAFARMGAETVQGYLFSPPRPAESVPAMLTQFGASLETSRAAE
jgi:diguanylate cyclase (GGDEF)-like protein/PAS domain S-box-containing protein